MFDLTISQISGIIAAIIIALQVLFPNALAVLVIGLLQNEHTLVTWSVIQRNVLSSLWPVILRTDSSASSGVDPTIRLIIWVRPFGLAMITIAAIVTPLGLYQDIVPSRSAQNLSMRDVRDIGPMGYGTPPRSGQGFTRSCGDFGPSQCPGTTVVIQTENVTSGPNNGSIKYEVVNDDYDMRIPKQLAELYQSGLSEQPASVSSFFDIETRQYGFDKSNENGIYIVDAFRYLTSVILNDKIEPVDGLIIDTVAGGIGFRHHTVPNFSGIKAEWQEDLLWIEPETVCVNTNLSIEMTVPPGGTAQPLNITLIDEGGFANINHTYPQCDLTDPQRDPQLYCRAHKAAWMTSAYVMFSMNITRPSPKAFSYLNSYTGARFPMTKEQVPNAALQGITLSSLFSYLVTPDTPSNYSLQNAPGANYSNPFKISITNFSVISVICSGAGGMDYTNITNINVACGLLFGAPYQADGDDTLIFVPGSIYRQPIYTCASTNKASIKTVHLEYSASDGAEDTLNSLRVLDVKPKQYNSTVDMPLWGVETVDFVLDDLQQLWGLIDSEHANAVNLSTVRQPHLYLPGYQHVLSTEVNGFDYVPGLSAPTAVLQTVYDSASAPADYSGRTNMALYVKWRNLSQYERSAPKIIDLIWTDLAANLMTGTRGWNSKNSLPANLQKRSPDTRPSIVSTSSNLVPVIVYRSAVRYHWYYGIPAIIVLAFVGVVVLIALCAMLIKRARPSYIKYCLHQFSAGRMMASQRFPMEDNTRMPTSQWISIFGRRRCGLSQRTPEAESSVFFYGDEDTAYTTHALDATHKPLAIQFGVNNDYQIVPPSGANSTQTTKGYTQIRSEDVKSEDWFNSAKQHGYQ